MDSQSVGICSVPSPLCAGPSSSACASSHTDNLEWPIDQEGETCDCASLMGWLTKRSYVGPPHAPPQKMHRSNFLALSRNSLEKQWQGKRPAHSFGGALEHWVCVEDMGLPGKRGHGVNTSASYVNHNKTVHSVGDESHSESVISKRTSTS